MQRRAFLRLAGGGLAGWAGACTRRATARRSRVPTLLFASAGKTCLIRVDGTGLRPLEVAAPGQVTWQPAGFLPDGRVLLLSMEARRDGPGRPFDQFYHQTPTHVWAHDWERGGLEELATRDRQAPFYTPQLLLADGRILMQVIRERPGQILNMKLDGSDAREFTGSREGLPYGFSLSPDGQRVAFHLAGPEGYQIWTCDTLGGHRARVAADRDQLFFGPGWSPDGQWLAYQACTFRADPGHDWSDLCLGRPDGSSHRLVTRGQAMWFAATYGRPGNRGGGSNLSAWTRDGTLLFPRRSPGSRVPWEYQAGRPDTDHFNREFRPEQSRGGTSLARLDPRTGRVEAFTEEVTGRWDFRAVECPEGEWVAFCRAETGGVPGLWVMDASGGRPRLLTRGLDEAGADHPRWIPRG
ncbi:MAG: TolB family protein [Verrucomicrobiota bacterium]